VTEVCAGERRVALTPASITALRKAGLEGLVQAGSGVSAGYTDAAYSEAGWTVESDRRAVLGRADILAQVRALGANGDGWRSDIHAAKPGCVLVGLMDPLTCAGAIAEAAPRGCAGFALEMLPRITRAQSMDVLSSQANLAGYKAALMAADASPKLFPMMMTAAGTVTPARVFVLGAGVAGLQAIATARRLGAIVTAYDVRPAVKEQVESLGARFAEIEMDTGDAQDAGGYAKELGPEFYAKQAEMMAGILAETDAVIATAAVPGRRAPILVTRAMVEQMRPGAVIVDLAAERGGNCELTEPGRSVEHNGVTVMGPLNVASQLPFHASQLYARNVATFLAHVVREGNVTTDTSDEIVAGTLVMAGGQVVHPRVLEAIAPEVMP
jgi:NAD(P) transhydrogenase subunit alpha